MTVTVARTLVLALLMLLAAACATRLVPAPDAQPAPSSRGVGAEGSVAGVIVRAWPQAWNAFPRSLPAIVTPFLVTVDNGGRVPIRVRHEDFALVAADGRRLAARGPYDLRGYALEPVPYPYMYAGPPLLLRHRWGWGPLDDPFWYGDPWIRVPLPTPEMVGLALPETAVTPGGVVTGFLYFDRATRDDKALDLTAQLEGANGEQLGEVRIPFLTR
jgi:hypothetical protein